MRSIEAQDIVLDAVIASAARADKTKVLRTIVDQGVAAEKAVQQQAIDAELAAHVRHLIAMARADALKAGELRSAWGGRRIISTRSIASSVCERLSDWFKPSILAVTAERQHSVYANFLLTKNFCS